MSLHAWTFHANGRSSCMCAQKENWRIADYIDRDMAKGRPCNDAAIQHEDGDLLTSMAYEWFLEKK